MKNIAFRFLYFLLHLSLSFYFFIYASLARITSFLFLCISHAIGVSFERSYLKHRVSSIKKIPIHVVLLFSGEDVFDHDGIARVTCWSIAANIRHITIFDMEGILKKRIPVLQVKILELVNRFFVDEVPKIFSFQHDSVMKAKSDFTIEIISLENGRWHLIDLCKQFCYSVEKRMLKPCNINRELISQQVCGRFSESEIFYFRGKLIGVLPHKMQVLPDPDLLLHFGPLHCISLDGFSPWQISLTEILQLGPLKWVTCGSFVSALEIYSGTEQRYGT